MKHMIKKTMLTGALSCFLLGTALADDATNQPAKPYWQDIQVVAVNKEAPRSSFMSYGDRATALSSRYEKSPFYSLLNGTWKFYFVDSYKDLPANITDPSVSTSDWDDITVPGNWEVQGHGTAIYTNHGYEFKPRNPQPPLLPEANPVGVYRRDFEVPAGWDGRDIYHRRNAGGDSLGRRLPVLAAGRKYAAERAGVGRSSAVGRPHLPDDAGLQQHHPREVGRNADFHHADPSADDSDPLPQRKAPKTAADADAALPALDRIVLLLRQSRRRNECLGRADRIVGFGAV